MDAGSCDTIFINDPRRFSEVDFLNIRLCILENSDLKLEYSQNLFREFFDDYLTWFNVSLLMIGTVYFTNNELCGPVFWFLMSGLVAILYLMSILPCYLLVIDAQKQDLKHVRKQLMLDVSYEHFMAGLTVGKYDDRTLVAHELC